MANNKVVLSDGTTLMDITDTTATAEDVLTGKYFYGANGVKVEGSKTVPIIQNGNYLFYLGARANIAQDLLSICQNVTSTSRMFYTTSLITTAVINEWLSTLNNYNNTKMDEMFNACTGITGVIDMSTLSFSSCDTMYQMFRLCNGLQTIKIGNSSTSFKQTINTGQLFYGCGSLENVVIGGRNVLPASSYDFMNNVPATCKIYVPDSLVNSYKISTNWSSRSNYIFPKSEYVEV